MVEQRYGAHISAARIGLQPSASLQQWDLL